MQMPLHLPGHTGFPFSLGQLQGFSPAYFVDEKTEGQAGEQTDEGRTAGTGSGLLRRPLSPPDTQAPAVTLRAHLRSPKTEEAHPA